MRLKLFRRNSWPCVQALYFTLFLLSACGGWPVAASAQDVWKGGTGNWNNSTKWTAGVPTSSSSVFVDHGNALASSVTVSDGEQSGNLTIDSDDSVTVLSNAILAVFGATISNAGTLAMSATTSGANFDISGAVTLTGAGTLNMSNSANNIIFGYGQGTGATLTNQSTIQGSGTIQPGCSNTFKNQHIVNANQSTPLILSICNGPSANTGTLEATNGGTLTLEGNTQGGGTFDNTGGGIIHADPSSIVQLYGSAIVKNGTLTTSGSGAVQCAGNNGFCTLNGATNSGTHQVVSGGEYLANTVTNNGSFQVGTISTGVNLDISGNVILKGTGTLSMSNLSTNTLFGYGQGTGATLTNQSTIQGSGTIQPGCSNTFNNQHIVDANQTTPLYISICNGPSANAGTLEATNGGTLVLEGNAEGGGTFDNTGGTIHADAGSTVVLYDSAIVKNGNLTSSSTGKTQCNGSNGACTLDGVTLSGTHQVISSYENLTNTVTNNGSFQMLGTNTNNVNIDISGSAILKGSGTLTMGGPGNTIFGFYQPSPGNTLTNQSTIHGGGNINPGSGNNFINQHIVSATQNLTINGNFSNPGTLMVSSGKTLYISAGLFSNFSGNTLTGGKYTVTGTLAFDGASIVNNAAGITLTGTTALIANQSNVNALTNLETNTSTGSFTVTAGQQFTTTLSGGFSNAGKVMVGKNSSVKIACTPNFQCPYIQTAGTTTVDGTLTDNLFGVQIKGGKLFGTGTIAASVTSSGAVTAGDALTKAGVLSPNTYTQNATGTLSIQIGGTTVGTQYSRLAAANGASLNGTLNVKLINTFVPAIGDVFTIVTASAVTGTFKTTNLPLLSGAHWVVSYNATNVTLTVASGA